MSVSAETGTPRGLDRSRGVRRFVETENASAVFLFVATVVAVAWANSPWSASYHALWETEMALAFGTDELVLDLRHWVNSGLMAFFFFVAGLEIRREFDLGDLRERRRVAIPVIAAIGGMVVPALIYLAFNLGESSARGWGIVMGTDTAFAIGVLTLVGGASSRVRNFLLTVVVIDDAIALTVIAVAYTDDLSIVPLLVSVAFLGAVLGLKAAHVRHGAAYFLVGTGVWLAMLASGVHATIAGVAMGLMATAYPPTSLDLSRAGTMWRLFREDPNPELARAASRTLALSVSPNERLQHLFHPWTSFFVVPLFALANAGVEISADGLREAAISPITLGIVAGLVIGKFVGITGATWVAWRFAKFPLTVPWPPLFGAAALAGIGFTVSLLIADISFQGQDLVEAKLGILGASFLAAVLSWGVFRITYRLGGRTGIDGLAAPIIDLSDPVDPDVDHIRGSLDASAVLVEYGDFECPHCLQAETMMEELGAAFGDSLAVVFRHLPLDDVHPNARRAAEFAEAAAAQGRFWEMHDELFANQDALREADLLRYAGELGLDVGRITADVHQRRHALRVERDLTSAEDSGATGTPTFFINGSRYRGRHDIASLTEALERQLETTPST